MMVFASIAIALVLTVAFIGYGFLLLRSLSIVDERRTWMTMALSFGAGIGLVGWLMFFVGVAGAINVTSMTALVIPGLAAAVTFHRYLLPAFPRNLKRIEWGLLTVLGVVVLFDFVEALSPPGDADSLAYHFALVRKFAETGAVVFEPRAIDGAIPLLIQMTYLPAFVLGGETAMTTWTFLSGLAAGGLLYAILREHLNFSWSMTISILYLTLPAVVYGAGSGQVEVRNSIFVLLAAYAVSKALSAKQAGFAILAGVAAGCFAASKYLGLFFVLASGIALLMGRGWFKRGTLFSLGVICFGFQWYLWNWVHTGDPVFPVLYNYIGNFGLDLWSDAHQVNLKSYLANETILHINITSLLTYPILATLKAAPAFDSLRVGFGPYPLLILPFAIGGLVKFRAVIFKSPLLVYTVICLIFYTIWFLSDTSQRVRHLLPVMPLVLVVLSVSANRFADKLIIAGPLIAVFVVTLVIQLSGHFLFSVKSFRYVFSDDTRRSYLARTVSWYEPVEWANDNLTEKSRILSTIRWYGYLFEPPYYWAHPHTQALVNLLPGSNDLGRFLYQIRNMGITHLLQTPIPLKANIRDATFNTTVYNGYIRRLLLAKCISEIRSFEVQRFASRTLSQSNSRKSKTAIYELSKNCTLQ